MTIIQFLSAFGFGAIITALVQSWLSYKSDIAKRNFQEKKEAYIGLLDAYHKAAVENSNVAAKNFAFWQMRCDLVAPKKVRDAIQEIVDTNDDKEKRYIAHEKLKNVLRKDLSVNSGL